MKGKDHVRSPLPAPLPADARGGAVAGALVVTLPLRLSTGQNEREHWRARHRRVAAEKAATTLALKAAGSPPSGLRYVVTLTRVAPSNGLDTDNLSGSLKAVRDAVALHLGCGDGPIDPVRWEYAQRRGPWGVEIEVRGE